MKITTILEEAIELGRCHGFEEDHAVAVSKLSLRLFDELQPLHQMGNSERIWLRLASLLHDVGKSVSGPLHHKASRDIIIKEANIPFRKRVRKIIGLIARYHRGDLPKDSHKYYRQLDDDAKQCVKKLAALIRLADALDAEHKQMVTNLTCEIKKNRVILYLALDDETELRKVVRKADLFEQVFNKQVEIRTMVAGRLRTLRQRSGREIRLDSVPTSLYARAA